MGLGNGKEIERVAAEIRSLAWQQRAVVFRQVNSDGVDLSKVNLPEGVKMEKLAGAGVLLTASSGPVAEHPSEVKVAADHPVLAK